MKQNIDLTFGVVNVFATPGSCGGLPWMSLTFVSWVLLFRLTFSSRTVWVKKLSDVYN